MPPNAFVDALEKCITELATTVSRTSSIWADHCESPGDKTVFQARQMAPILGPLYRSQGYTAVLWCAIYTGGWPMGWTDGDWYADFLCPEANGHRYCSGHDEVGYSEAAGVPSGQGGYDAPIYTMSCALCQRLNARFGKAPYNLRVPPIPSPGHAAERYQGMAQTWEQKLDNRGYWDRWPGWDMHAFGLWYAEERWPVQLDDVQLAEEILRIAKFRLTNGACVCPASPPPPPPPPPPPSPSSSHHLHLHHHALGPALRRDPARLRLVEPRAAAGEGAALRAVGVGGRRVRGHAPLLRWRRRRQQ